MITLLIWLIVIAVILYCARLVISTMALPGPIGTIIYVLIILIALIFLLNRLGMMGDLNLR